MNTTDPNETFRNEAGELLEMLQSVLIELEETPQDMDLLSSAFRALHKIKGSGAMFGYTAAASFVHEFETVFDGVRKGLTPASPGLIRVALAACDHIHTLVQSPDADGDGGDEILDALRKVVGAAPSAPLPVAASTATGEPAEGWRVRFRLPSDALVLGTSPMLLLEELSAFGPCDIRALVGGVPEFGALDPEASYLAWDVTLHADVPRESVEDVFMFLSMEGDDLVIEPLGGDGPNDPAGTPAGSQPAVGHAASSTPLGEATAAGRSAEGNGTGPARSFRMDKGSTSLRMPNGWTR